MATVSFNVNFPDYDIISELGRGNARVLKARHRPTGDLVAIKQFALNTDPDTLRRFARESDILMGISHPNIVRVREMQLEAAMPYLVMEFVEGGDLRSLLRTEGRLSMGTLLRLGLQMTETFKVIHSRGIIHRDIKPENILYRRLVSGELHFLLTDFGIAKIRDDQSTRTRTGQSLMTYEYAAPEQFDDPRQINVATDYYALGVVLYESLTGHVPFPLDNEAGLAQFMKQVLTATPPPPRLPDGQFIPPSLMEAMRRMLTKDPVHRLSRADDLELLLEQAKVELLRASHAQFTEPAADESTQAGWSVVPPAPAPPVYQPPTPPLAESEQSEPYLAAQPAYSEPATTPLLAESERGRLYPATADEAPDRTTWWFLGGVGVVGIGILLFVLINQNRPSDQYKFETDTTAVSTTAIDSSQLFTPPSQPVDTVATEPTPPAAETMTEDDPAETQPVQTPTTSPELDSAATMGVDST